MKLWIDDVRRAPEGWKQAWSSDEAVLHMTAYRQVDEVSFDHDLGGDDTTRPVVLWMIENLPVVEWPRRITVHTANPVGRKWLVGTLTRYAPDGVEVIG